MDKIPSWVIPSVATAALAGLGTGFVWLLELSEGHGVLAAQHAADVAHIREQGTAAVALMQSKIDNLETRLDILASIVRQFIGPGMGRGE